ncbi:hypothetical protein NDU88_005536 [Pleurodeles waltl]|uniref:Uncharacterized protein n=1 Tax=Pleurodeles waltl TaxID=8319 RepID=A0AAV7QJB4_PLEWA|nr:hypothetical protein NDU88_005536 [Pleurodeles waltl]
MRAANESLTAWDAMISDGPSALPSASLRGEEERRQPCQAFAAYLKALSAMDRIQSAAGSKDIYRAAIEVW